MQGEHGIKLSWSVMEPILLVQTRVPAGDGESQNKGKGRTSEENMEGENAN